MATDLLDANDLEELTGLTQPAAQARWLRDNHIRHFRRPDGTVAVTLYAVHHPVTTHQPANDAPAPRLETINA